MADAQSPPFTQNRAREIWSGYLRQVNELCSLLDARQTADIEMEIRAHLLESYVQIEGGDEASRIATAVERLGDPREFVPLWVEERLLDGAQPGSSTRNLISLLRSNAIKGLGQFAFSMVVGFGYLMSFYFFIMAILKLFFPAHVGLYMAPAGFPFLGYVDADEFTELLGYWLTPLGLAVAVTLQYLLTRCVARWMIRHSNQERTHV